MSPKRWRQIHELFDELVELDPEQQKTRLHEIGQHDERLRDQLESLLIAYDRADEILAPLDDRSRQRSPTHSPLRAGQMIGHYEILGEIGRGGMGTVYRALDTRLERPIALKFLSRRFDTEKQIRRRFMREARTASALDHPNIAVIYDIDEADGIGTYIAMRYYEGKTLAEKTAGGPLPIDESVDLAQQVGRGLEAAHEAEIIHRDIKPSNVIVTAQGIAKILDFGLAKFTTGSDLTQTGSTLGTPAYMSPEQIRGEQVDHRTDLWALGVVLYEMVTGQRCFKADYEQALLYSILYEDPEPVARIRAEVPPALVAVIGQLLKKDPSARYSTTASVIEDLAAVDEGTSEAANLPSRSIRSPYSAFGGSKQASPSNAFELQRPTDLDYSDIWNKTLAADETAVHEFSISRRYTKRLSTFLVGIFILSVIGNSISEIFSTTSFLLLLALFYLQYYLPRARAYVLTNRRFVAHQGWLSPEVTSIPYHRITQVRVKEPFFQRKLFKTGKVMIDVRETTNPAVELNHIDNPYVIKNRIDELSDRSKHGNAQRLR